jgi:hypothetical protein
MNSNDNPVKDIPIGEFMRMLDHHRETLAKGNRVVIEELGIEIIIENGIPMIKEIDKVENLGEIDPSNNETTTES